MIVPGAESRTYVNDHFYHPHCGKSRCNARLYKFGPLMHEQLHRARDATQVNNPPPCLVSDKRYLHVMDDVITCGYIVRREDAKVP